MLPISAPTSAPISEAACEPASEAACEPLAEALAEPLAEHVCETSSAAAPETDPVADPVTTASQAEAAAPVGAAMSSDGAPMPPAAARMSPADCAAQLKQLFPALFTGVAKPLKLRIQADIQARAPGLFTKPLLSVVLRRYTGSHSYLVALTQATHRFDLDGAPAGELSAEHKQVAMDELTLRRANLKAAQRAPQKSAQRNKQSSGVGAAAVVHAQVTSETALETALETLPQIEPQSEPKAHTRPDARSDVDKAAQHHIQKTAQRETRAAQRVDAERHALEDQKRRNRATLLHDFENTTLTAANFSALKGITVEAMQGYLATAREEAKARRSAPLGAAQNTTQNAVSKASESIQQTGHQRSPGQGESRDRRPRHAERTHTDGRNNRPAREPQR